MLVIRLVRIGRRNLAHFRLVVSEKRSKLRGKVVDLLGSYNPHKKELSGVSKEKIEEWIKRGAQLSSSAARLLNKELGFNFPVVEKKKAPKEKEVKVREKEGKAEKPEVPPAQKESPAGQEPTLPPARPETQEEKPAQEVPADSTSDNKEIEDKSPALPVDGQEDKTGNL